jgi:hypothetical protein
VSSLLKYLEREGHVALKTGPTPAGDFNFFLSFTFKSTQQFHQVKPNTMATFTRLAPEIIENCIFFVFLGDQYTPLLEGFTMEEAGTDCKQVTIYCQLRKIEDSNWFLY